MKFEETLDAVEKILGYYFQNRLLLLEAILHKSYASHFRLEINYERLEYLGDAILQLYVSELLFRRPTDEPGELTKMRSFLVSRNTLQGIMRDLGLESLVYVHHSLRKDNGEISGNFLGDFFESILAAIYLDGGKEVADSFLDQFYQDYEDWICPFDFKSELQEICLKLAKELPVYDTIPLGSNYEAKVWLQGSLLSCGQGRSKKKAEQLAAKGAIQALNETK